MSIFNKPIWVTEWNLQMSKTTGNTLLQSLFVANYLLELLSSPDLKNIELTTYHNLGGRDFSGSIFRNNKDKMEIQSTYSSMSMIGKIFKNDIVRVEKELKGEVFSYKCFNKKGNQLFTYVIDWNLKEIICYDKSLELDGIIEEVHISSNNLFDLPDINGKFRLDSIIQIISNE